MVKNTQATNLHNMRVLGGAREGLGAGGAATVAGGCEARQGVVQEVHELALQGGKAGADVVPQHALHHLRAPGQEKSIVEFAQLQGGHKKIMDIRLSLCPRAQAQH